MTAHDTDPDNMRLRDAARALASSALFLRRAAVMLPGSTEWRRQVRQARTQLEAGNALLRIAEKEGGL